jgi:hypothetical protein
MEFIPPVQHLLRELWTDYFGRLRDQYRGADEMVLCFDLSFSGDLSMFLSIS